MQWICVREFGLHKPGSVVELPDGASVDPEHWERYQPAAAPPPDDPPKPPAPVTPAAAVTPKEGM